MKYLGPVYVPNNRPFCVNEMPMGGFKRVNFLNIIDGDTAHFLVDGEDVTVRFIAIDTPEIHPNAKPYAIQAKDYTNNILSNAKTIYLQSEVNDGLYDETESRRLLAWVWADYKLLNYQLVERGYAIVRYVYSNKLMYLKDLYTAQEIAMKNKRRIHNTKETA